jgi:hypothetical protein
VQIHKIEGLPCTATNDLILLTDKRLFIHKVNIFYCNNGRPWCHTEAGKQLSLSLPIKTAATALKSVEMA